MGSSSNKKPKKKNHAYKTFKHSFISFIYIRLDASVFEQTRTNWDESFASVFCPTYQYAVFLTLYTMDFVKFNLMYSGWIKCFQVIVFKEEERKRDFGGTHPNVSHAGCVLHIHPLWVPNYNLFCVSVFTRRPVNQSSHPQRKLVRCENSYCLCPVGLIGLD